MELFRRHIVEVDEQLWDKDKHGGLQRLGANYRTRSKRQGWGTERVSQLSQLTRQITVRPPYHFAEGITCG